MKVTMPSLMPLLVVKTQVSQREQWEAALSARKKAAEIIRSQPDLKEHILSRLKMDQLTKDSYLARV